VIFSAYNLQTLKLTCLLLARFQVDKRRLELEQLERRIFPAGRALVHQDSASSLEGVPSATDDSTIKTTARLEQAFERLKAVTGTDQFCCNEEQQLQPIHNKASTFLVPSVPLCLCAYILSPTENINSVSATLS
jgi:hypothetical protein